MKRTPIISAGQVYLHTDMNEYLVVTKSTRGEIQFKGPGIGGQHEAELFLNRFGPVDPADLDADEQALLIALLDKPGVALSTGWVCTEDDEDFADAELEMELEA
jgi:hypothetical protein